MKTISSPENQLFKDLKASLEPKGIKKHGLYIISGQKFVAESLQAPTVEAAYLVASPEMPLPKNAGKSELIIFTKELFSELDLFGTKSPLLVVRVPQLRTWTEGEKPDGLEILCALGEPSNLGACLRSAAAFGASKVVLLKECATPFHPKALRAAAGMTHLTPLFTGPSIRDLKGQAVVALDMNGESLASFRWPKSARLLLGQEGPGLPADAVFNRVSIPMKEGVESLNATVAASCALFAYRMQHAFK